MYKNIYIILLLLLIIVINLYLVKFYYNKNDKNTIIKKIIQAWNNKSNGGNVKEDKNGRYEGDIYLSINNHHDNDSHIHLIKRCAQSDFLCYIIKKDNKHSELYIIDENKNIEHLVNEMIENYNNFE